MKLLAVSGRTNQLLPSPGLAWGHYPQREQGQARSAGKARWQLLFETLGSKALPAMAARRSRKLSEFAERCDQRITSLTPMDEQTLEAMLKGTRAQTSLHGLSEPLLLELTALVAEYARRTLGKRAYPVQLMAVRTLLDNALAQMQTGEGKTLAVGLSACVAALAGVPVLVITANDYLVARDRELMSGLFDKLNIAHGLIIRESTPEDRRHAYAQAICYCTAKELGFDYLRDLANRSAQDVAVNKQVHSLVGSAKDAGSMPMMRGLCMAIIDEADSILLDEAITPLILSRAVRDEAQVIRLRQALTLAKGLWPTTHYASQGLLRSCQLTEAGQRELSQKCSGPGFDDKVWGNTRLREELVCKALAALHVYLPDRDYVIREGVLKMIDQPTGRVAEGRKWSRGIHQLLELKEGLAVTEQTETIAQISYQQLFPRFLRMCGVSGSLMEAQSELARVYGLTMTDIPLNRVSKRRTHPILLFANSKQKWRGVLSQCKTLHQQGRPILLGTDSVASARHLSRMLHNAGLVHQVLTAAKDDDEARIIAGAGSRQAITITTNLAGRGTDIHVEDEVEKLGGLAVVSCYLNPERRIDRQLIGRAARQGQQGSSHTFISLDDTLFIKTVPQWLDQLLRSTIPEQGRVAWPWLVRYAQWREESRASHQRMVLLGNQQVKEKLLAMAGKSE